MPEPQRLQSPDLLQQPVLRMAGGRAGLLLAPRSQSPPPGLSSLEARRIQSPPPGSASGRRALFAAPPPRGSPPSLDESVSAEKGRDSGLLCPRSASHTEYVPLPFSGKSLVVAAGLQRTLQQSLNR